VVVGSAHHGNTGQILAGSVGTSVLHGSPCSVAIAPRGFAERAVKRLSELVVGVDGTPEADMALAEGIELARAAGATLKLIAVAEPPTGIYGKGGGPNYSSQAVKEEIVEVMRERLGNALATVPGDVRVEATLADGHAQDVLTETARPDGGLLLLGSRGYGPLRSVPLGSVSTPLVRSAPCPLIVHPRPAKVREATADPVEATTAA
jgi:nucleotide-binding universal stress UspA family protein